MIRVSYLFSYEASEKEMKVRNFLLRLIRIPLWIMAIISFIRIMISVQIAGDNLMSSPSTAEWLIITISIALLSRFEFWVTNFISRAYSRSGQSWAISGFKDNRSFQTKFFTGEYHKGEKNPLW